LVDLRPGVDLVSGATVAMMIGAPVYALPSADVFETRPIAASAGISIKSNGDFTSTTIAAGEVDLGDWISPKGLAPNGCTIRCHKNSGTNPSGDALDSDLALTSTRSWSVSQVGAGSTTANITLTLKDVSGNTLKTSTINITATSS
jgi:hypothetical protein